MANLTLNPPVYAGSSKHKRDPASFGLPPFNGERGDATLCDQDATFGPDRMALIPALIQRGLAAGLVGDRDRGAFPSILWTVDDTGWIFELRLTNQTAGEYHGYPVRPGEAIAEEVHQRFTVWVDGEGAQADRAAAAAAKVLYGFA